MASQPRDIILFDGVCNLCNASVNFVIRWDRRALFHFASIQSEAGGRLLKQYGLPRNFDETVIYIEDGAAYFRSAAALRIGRKLSGPWPLLARLGQIVPVPLRDRVYDWVAVHRYRWFGRRDVCMLPAEKLVSRFL